MVPSAALSGVAFLRRAVGLLLAAACLLAPGAAAQIFRLPHADTTAGNFFGNAVALDGDRALVGASGVDLCGENAGAAYLYERDPATDDWRAVAHLVPSDCAPERFFGRSVALSGDRALVAASAEFFRAETSNAAYIFERDSTGTWREAARLTMGTAETEGSFATSVSLDGDRALITTSGDPVKGRYNGAAYIFERDPATGEWVRQARLTGSAGPASGVFGGAAALDGDRAVVAASTYFAYRPGLVYVFERDPATGRWHEAARLGGIDDFFISVDVDGDVLLVGESKAGPSASGVATLYRRDAAGRWSLFDTLRPRTPYRHGAFGATVALQGGRALVVGFDEQLGFDFNIDRVVYVFACDATGHWAQQQIIDIGEVGFAAAVALDAGHALIGDATDHRPGAAYVVRVR